MNKKYHFGPYYTVIPLLVGPILVLVEYMNIVNQQVIYQEVAATAAILALMYLSLRYDYCSITSDEFSRRSYFIWRKSIPKSKIAEITFPPTWIASPEARTLVVWGGSGQKITMTDMGYTRPVLADVVNTLVEINPSIRFDQAAKSLIS